MQLAGGRTGKEGITGRGVSGSEEWEWEGGG